MPVGTMRTVLVAMSRMKGRMTCAWSLLCTIPVPEKVQAIPYPATLVEGVAEGALDAVRHPEVLVAIRIDHLVRGHVLGDHLQLVEQQHADPGGREAVQERRERHERVAQEDLERPAREALERDKVPAHVNEDGYEANLREELRESEHHKWSVVFFSDSAIQPDAIVIKLLDARARLRAVLRAQALEDPRCGAKAAQNIDCGGLVRVDLPH